MLTFNQCLLCVKQRVKVFVCSEWEEALLLRGLLVLPASSKGLFPDFAANIQTDFFSQEDLFTFFFFSERYFQMIQFIQPN